MKTCNTCNRELPYTEYYKSGKNPSGSTKYASNCKECTKIIIKEKAKIHGSFYQRNKDRLRKGIPASRLEYLYTSDILFTIDKSKIVYIDDENEPKSITNPFKKYDDGEPMILEDQISHIKSYLLSRSSIIRKGHIHYIASL
jgi:hypothetical protein